ncbi:MAG: DnaK suppressor protein [Verrucomicrobiales bacterium]|jgi:DnaK suppressor protein
MLESSCAQVRENPLSINRESDMTSEERDQMRERIIDQLVETKSRIADLEEITKPIAPDQALGRLTRLDGMLDKSVNEAALARLRNDFVQLQNAMVNVAKPDFGLCRNCGEPIAMVRMEAMPQSTLCIACASPG